jgi:hypothetical protein
MPLYQNHTTDGSLCHEHDLSKKCYDFCTGSSAQMIFITTSIGHAILLSTLEP